MAIDKMKRVFLMLSIFYMFILFFISSLPGTAGPENPFSSLPSFLQNLLHVPAFGILSFLWILTLKAHQYHRRVVIAGSVFLSGIYGVILEYYQAFIPGRHASMMDILLNLVGAVIFCLMYVFFKTYRPIF